jgi:plastocyanin
MNAFVVAGAVMAVWAVLVAFAGMRGFPSSKAGRTLAITVTALLFAGALTSAIADQTKVGERKGKEIEKPAEKPAAQPQAAGPATQLALSADPTGQLKFDKTALEAKAGQVTITLTNPASVPHNVSLKGGGVDEHGQNVQNGDKSTVNTALKTGSYEFYCSVPGHEQAGMKGTLTVK